MDLYNAIGLLIVFTGIGILAWFINRMVGIGKTEKSNAVNKNGAGKTEKTERNFKSREYFLSTLQKIGCTYQIDENDRIGFSWQGGNFIADVSDDCPFVVVWYLGWGEFELYDIDTFSRVRKAVNSANINHNMNVIYSVDKEGGIYHLHTKKHFLFITSIEEADLYLTAILGEFFNVRRFVETEVEKLKVEEENLEK